MAEGETLSTEGEGVPLDATADQVVNAAGRIADEERRGIQAETARRGDLERLPR